MCINFERLAFEFVKERAFFMSACCVQYPDLE